MTQALIDTLEALAAKATPGPWRVCEPPEDWDLGGIWLGTGDYEYSSNVVGNSCCCCGEAGFYERSDAELVVELKNNLPAILSALCQAGEAERLREAVNDGAATLLAVRATSTSSEWEESAKHFHGLCGQTITRMNAALEGTPDD
jgi:hypothetical protein